MARSSSRGTSSRSAPTIYDVAEAAGVSPSTVSRALNKPGRINAATEKRIRDHADALGYQLNPMARAVITGRSDTLGLILSDITNPVYFDFIRGAQQVVGQHSRTLVLAESQESADRELATAQRLRPAVDGLILVASRMSDDDILKLAESKPVTVVNRHVAGVESIVPDIGVGLREAVDHLASLGHRRIGYLAGPPTSWMNTHRRSTLFEHAASIGMTTIEIPSAAPTLQGGRDSLNAVLAADVSAVLTYNDLMALGLLDAARTASVDIPGRLSIIGVDDIFGAELVSPALTTVRSPLRAMGERAVETLLDEAESGSHLLSTELVVRSSTGETAV